MQAARTETVGLTHSVKDLKGLLSGESERSKGLQQQLAEAQSIQKVSSAQVCFHTLPPLSKLPLLYCCGWFSLL